jgi:hypothetical protein
LPLLWNVLIYYLLYAIVWALLMVCVLLIWFGGWLVSVFNMFLEPVLDFFIEDVFPYVVDILILGLSWLFAIFLYLITLGSANLYEIQALIESILTVYSDFFMLLFSNIGYYLSIILMYSANYVLLIGMCYLKFEYAKAKGLVNRAEQLEQSFDAYIYPLKLGWNAIVSMKNFVFGWI